MSRMALLPLVIVLLAILSTASASSLAKDESVYKQGATSIRRIRQLQSFILNDNDQTAHQVIETLDDVDDVELQGAGRSLAATSTHGGSSTNTPTEEARQRTQGGPLFVRRIRQLKAAVLGAGGSAEARRLIESLDEVDDLELAQLRLPRRALAATPTYGPPPPPASPPFTSNGFPYTGCKTSPSSPYTFALTSSETTEEGELVCGTVRTRACDAADSCCSANLFRVNFHVNDVCGSSVAWTTYGSASRGPTFENVHGPDKLIFKVTQMYGINATTANDLKVCFQLRKPCNTLGKFCWGGACEVALMDQANRCCPLSVLPNSA